MPAKSKAQQRFFGMVDAVQKGEMPKKDASKSVRKAADSMTRKEVKKFASTKTNKLPDHVKNEKIERIIKESIRKVLKENYELQQTDKMADDISDMVSNKAYSYLNMPNNKGLLILIMLLFDPRYTLESRMNVSFADFLSDGGSKLYNYLKNNPQYIEMVKSFLEKM